MLKLLSVYRACICVLAVLIVTLYSLSQGDLDYSFSKNINVRTQINLCINQAQVAE